MFVQVTVPEPLQGSIKLETPVHQVNPFQFYLFSSPSVNSGIKKNKKSLLDIKIIVLSLTIHLHLNKIKMTTEQLQLLINLHGSREVSNRLVNSRINRIVGLDMNDLPDTSDLCDIVDELDELLQSKDYTFENIKNILDGIDMEFIQDMVFG